MESVTEPVEVPDSLHHHETNNLIRLAETIGRKPIFQCLSDGRNVQFSFVTRVFALIPFLR